MRSAGKLIAMLVGLALTAPVNAQQAAGSADGIVVPGEQEKKDQKVVCKKKQQQTMSRLPTRICRTVGEWNAIREQSVRDAREFIDRAIVDTNRSN